MPGRMMKAALQSSAVLAVATGATLLLLSPSPKVETLVGSPKMLTVVWDTNSNNPPGTFLNIYHSSDLTLPLKSWPWLTNFPFTNGSGLIAADRPFDFFVCTLSNQFGESGFGTK